MTNKGKKSDVSTDGALSLCFGAHTLSHGARDRVRAHRVQRGRAIESTGQRAARWHSLYSSPENTRSYPTGRGQ